MDNTLELRVETYLTDVSTVTLSRLMHQLRCAELKAIRQGNEARAEYCRAQWHKYFDHDLRFFVHHEIDDMEF